MLLSLKLWIPLKLACHHPKGLLRLWRWNKAVVSSDNFFCKVLDDLTNWIAKPYSPLEGAFPPLFNSLINKIASRYSSLVWGGTFFYCSTLISHLQVHFQDDFETQAYNPQRFARQSAFDQGVLGHLFTSAPPAIVTSLAFKSSNLIKVLVFGSEVPFASPSRTGLPSPKFKTWWSSIRERVRNFGENGSQHVDIPPIFQGDLTLKLSAKSKPLTIKRKRKNHASTVKKPRVCTFFFYFVIFVMFFL